MIEDGIDHEKSNGVRLRGEHFKIRIGPFYFIQSNVHAIRH